jgi:hypothetical protein
MGPDDVKNLVLFRLWMWLAQNTQLGVWNHRKIVLSPVSHGLTWNLLLQDLCLMGKLIVNVVKYFSLIRYFPRYPYLPTTIVLNLPLLWNHLRIICSSIEYCACGILELYSIFLWRVTQKDVLDYSHSVFIFVYSTTSCFSSFPSPPPTLCNLVIVLFFYSLSACLSVWPKPTQKREAYISQGCTSISSES